MIEGHGDDLFRYDGKVNINFSSNIPQGMLHEGLREYLLSKDDLFRSYPEPAPVSIERLLAYRNGIEEGNVIVSSGATEIIYLLAQLYMHHHSAIFIPTFREYQDACRMFSHKITFIQSLDSIPKVAEVVWLCNPNNPTGITFNYDELKDIITRNKEKIFVIDQAYGLYSVKRVLTQEDAVNDENVIVIKSFTKQFMVPGLRLGYAIGAESLIRKLKSVRRPWSVSSMAIEAAKYLLNHDARYKIDYLSLHCETMRLISEIIKLGYKAETTDCNFFLARTKYGTSCDLKEWLVKNYGLLIRDASNFEGLNKQYFRIAAQTEKENNILISALKEWITLFS